MEYRAEAEEIIEVLNRNGVSGLYHFTCIENLPGIREMGGLCSKQQLEDAGRWAPPVPGGNDLSHRLDRQCGNWDKVSLNLTPHTPMAYHSKPEHHLCFFVIDATVAGQEGVVFTSGNATWSGQRRGTGLSGVSLIDFDAVRATPRPADREGWLQPVQAEVLVPERVHPDFVRRVVFVSEASMREGRRLWGVPESPEFTVEPRCFANQATGPLTIEFPYLDRLWLTDEVVDKQSVSRAWEHRFSFRRQRGGRITAVAHLQGMTGTQAATRWGPQGPCQITEMPTRRFYWHWPSVTMDDLPSGACWVEYHLDEIRWARLDFALME